MAMRKPGPYVALSAFYADDEKIMEAGEDAELLYVRMLAYASRTPMTEGWISDRVLESRLGILPRVAGTDAGVVAGTDAGSRAGRLRDSGLIERDGQGWRIKSWLRWNRSIEEMGRERTRDRERKASGNGGTRAGNDAGKGTGSDAGIPHRIPTDRSDQKHKHPRGRAPAREARFVEFWDTYPRKVAKGPAQKAWAKAVKDTEPDLIITALAAQAPLLGNRETRFIPHPASWLNARRWEDDPAELGVNGVDYVAERDAPRPPKPVFHDDD